mmetsp:Transcript_28814/g.82530  ORF Transcript_28814/g.82530 Transcript_28814/m.82530 type:complete len:342 (-) Transcript_28814:593-1618(-)
MLVRKARSPTLSLAGRHRIPLTDCFQLHVVDHRNNFCLNRNHVEAIEISYTAGGKSLFSKESGVLGYGPLTATKDDPHVCVIVVASCSLGRLTLVRDFRHDLFNEQEARAPACPHHALTRFRRDRGPDTLQDSAALCVAPVVQDPLEHEDAGVSRQVGGPEEVAADEGGARGEGAVELGDDGVRGDHVRPVEEDAAQAAVAREERRQDVPGAAAYVDHGRELRPPPPVLPALGGEQLVPEGQPGDELAARGRGGPGRAGAQLPHQGVEVPSQLRVRRVRVELEGSPATVLQSERLSDLLSIKLPATREQACWRRERVGYSPPWTDVGRREMNQGKGVRLAT